MFEQDSCVLLAQAQVPFGSAVGLKLQSCNCSVDRGEAHPEPCSYRGSRDRGCKGVHIVMVALLYVLGQLPARNYASDRVRDSAKDRVKSAPVDGSLEPADAGFEGTATDQRRPNWRFDSQSRNKPL